MTDEAADGRRPHGGLSVRRRTDGGLPDGGAPGRDPSAEAVVETASDAAEGLILSRYKQSDVDDMDVTVRFEDGTLEVDVYLDAPEEPDPAEVAQEAVEAAEAAVDELFEEA